MAVQVRREDDEAPVILELLTNGRMLEGLDTAESHALGVVLARLEEQLVEPFAANYTELVTKARQSVSTRHGGALQPKLNRPLIRAAGKAAARPPSPLQRG